MLAVKNFKVVIISTIDLMNTTKNGAQDEMMLICCEKLIHHKNTKAAINKYRLSVYCKLFNY